MARGEVALTGGCCHMGGVGYTNERVVGLTVMIHHFLGVSVKWNHLITNITSY